MRAITLHLPAPPKLSNRPSECFVYHKRLLSARSKGGNTGKIGQQQSHHHDAAPEIHTPHDETEISNPPLPSRVPLRGLCFRFERQLNFRDGPPREGYNFLTGLVSSVLCKRRGVRSVTQRRTRERTRISVSIAHGWTRSRSLKSGTGGGLVSGSQRWRQQRLRRWKEGILVSMAMRIVPQV